MELVPDLDKIKDMLKNGSNVLYTTEIEVSSYYNVIKRWVNFKTFKDLKFENELTLIKDVFKFHRSNLNHIILYYSRNLNNCLLMCRVNAQYINLSIPAFILKDKNESLIATFT